MQGPTTSDSDRSSPTTPDLVRHSLTLLSVRREEHNLTTREALQLFEAAGLPRNQRSIERYCADGKLDAFFDTDEARYFISRASVERLIGHLLEIKARHEAVIPVGGGPPISDGIRPATTTPREIAGERREATDPQKLEELQRRLAAVEHEKKELEKQNFTLSYEKSASDQMVSMMREQVKEDREAFFKQLAEDRKLLMENSRRIGELETKVLQIEGPKPESQSGPTTGVRQITEAEVVDDIRSVTRQSDASPASRSLFRSSFADIREQSSEEHV
jgi:hypothetical protein